MSMWHRVRLSRLLTARFGIHSVQEGVVHLKPSLLGQPTSKLTEVGGEWQGENRCCVLVDAQGVKWQLKLLNRLL